MSNYEQNKRCKEEFLSIVTRLHPDLDFSQAEYKRAADKVKVICPIHGEFWKYPNDLKNGIGCPRCSKIAASKVSKLKPLRVYLPFSKVDYVETLDPEKKVLKSTFIKFKCPLHGIQQRTVLDLSQGLSCPLCGKQEANRNKLISSEDALKQIPENKRKILNIDFPEKLYQGTSLKVFCKKHLIEFTSTLYQLRTQKYSCPSCAEEGVANSHRYTKEQYIALAKKVHGDKYDYSLVDYIDAHTNVKIICKEHGVFEQAFTYHVNERQGCPICALSKQSSKWEQDLSQFIVSHGFKIETSYRKWWGQKEIDIFIPALKLGFELNGAYYHNTSSKLGMKSPSYHKEKSEHALLSGIQLIHLWDTSSYKKNLDIIKTKLGLNRKIYARKTSLKRIPQKDANDFYDENHLKGSGGSGFSYGLFLENELIASMSFRPKSKQEIELTRFASKNGIQVVGGFSKLLKAFERENTQYTKIISFAYRDICPIPENSVYAKTGFTLLPGCSPMMFYYDRRTEKALNRQQFMKYKLASKWEDFDPSLTEKENCERHELYQCFDSGIWKFEKLL